MRFRAALTFDCGDLGKRVTLRYRMPDGMATDVVGILEFCDESSFGVRDRQSRLIYVTRADAVAGKVIPSPKWEDDD